VGEKNEQEKVNELAAQLEKLHARETGKRPESDQEEAVCPARLTRRELRERKRQEEQEAERQKLANATPPIILDTTSGYKLVLPSKDLPLTRDQVEEWRKHQDDRVAADSRLWRGETGRLASSLSYIVDWCRALDINKRSLPSPIVSAA